MFTMVNKDEYNSNVFMWRRNAKYVDDVLTDESNAFQARAEDTERHGHLEWLVANNRPN